MLPSDLVFGKPNNALAIAVEMMNDRTGLWQITPDRVSLLRQSNHLSPRSTNAVAVMLATASSGERFWKPTVDFYFALDEIKRRSMKVDKKTMERAIAEFMACAKRDNVAHREWVKNTLDILLRIFNEI